VTTAARLNHTALYVILFAMPLTGYAFSSAGGYSLKYFWTFSWPRLVADSPAIAHAGEVSHDTLAYAAVAWRFDRRATGRLTRGVVAP